MRYPPEGTLRLLLLQCPRVLRCPREQQGGPCQNTSGREPQGLGCSALRASQAMGHHGANTAGPGLGVWMDTRGPATFEGTSLPKNPNPIPCHQTASPPSSPHALWEENGNFWGGAMPSARPPRAGGSSPHTAPATREDVPGEEGLETAGRGQEQAPLGGGKCSRTRRALGRLLSRLLWVFFCFSCFLPPTRPLFFCFISTSGRGGRGQEANKKK